MKQTYIINLLLLLLSPGAFADSFFQASAVETSEFEAQPAFSSQSLILPVEEAFRFGSYSEDSDLRIFWQVLPGYYLYRDKFAISVAGKLVDVLLPEGDLRVDEIFGEVQVLEGLVEVSVELGADVLVEVHYQGCAAKGYCYPPQKKVLNSAINGEISGKGLF
jgi:thiol:disulfide interchange protein DsbD